MATTKFKSRDSYRCPDCGGKKAAFQDVCITCELEEHNTADGNKPAYKSVITRYSEEYTRGGD